MNDKKVVDLLSYRIEKSLKENGFKIMTDSNQNIKLVIKLKTGSGVIDGG